MTLRYVDAGKDVVVDVVKLVADQGRRLRLAHEFVQLGAELRAVPRKLRNQLAGAADVIDHRPGVDEDAEAVAGDPLFLAGMGPGGRQFIIQRCFTQPGIG